MVSTATGKDYYEVLGVSKNLSPGGIRFEAVGCEIDLGDLIRVTFNVGESTVVAVGRVAWATETDPITLDVGVEFVDIDAEALQVLEEEPDFLKRLEERLVFPASSQMALFLSVEPAEEFRLDAVEVELDGERLTSHVYDYRELQALLDGGVQRLQVTNVTAGEHRLDVTIRGVAADDIDYEVSGDFDFEKTTGPRLIELRVVGTASRTPDIEIVSRQ